MKGAFAQVVCMVSPELAAAQYEGAVAVATPKLSSGLQMSASTWLSMYATLEDDSQRCLDLWTKY